MYKRQIVVLTDMVDKYNQPIIVPIKVAKDGTTEIGNVVPSMYGRKGFRSFMEEQEKKGNILFMDKERIRNSSLSTGVQFPEPFNTDADPMLRIAQRKGIVNAEELKNIQKGHKLQACLLYTSTTFTHRAGREPARLSHGREKAATPDGWRGTYARTEKGRNTPTRHFSTDAEGLRSGWGLHGAADGTRPTVPILR